MSLTKSKIILIIAILAILSLIWIWADIYVFEDGSIYTTLPKKSVAVQRIEALGEDFRSYEYRLKSEPNWLCVFAAGDQKAGLFCINTEDSCKARPQGANNEFAR